MCHVTSTLTNQRRVFKACLTQTERVSDDVTRKIGPMDFINKLELNVISTIWNLQPLQNIEKMGVQKMLSSWFKIKCWFLKNDRNLIGNDQVSKC